MATESNNNLEPTKEAVEAHLVTLNESMHEYDLRTAETQEMRRALLAKLFPQAMNLDMSVEAGTDPDLYAAQSRFLERVTSLLNDVDTSARNQVNMKLKQTDMENQNANTINAAEFLSQIKAAHGWIDNNTPVQTEEDIEKAAKAAFDDNHVAILDTEMEEGVNQLPELKPEDE